MQPKELPGTTSDEWQKLRETLKDVPKPDSVQTPTKWSKEQKVTLVTSYVGSIIWNDIKISVNHGAYLAGLSLTLALIDYLAGFLQPEETSYRVRYTRFVNEYLANYGDKIRQGRAEDLFRDLRSAFFHNLVLTTPDDNRAGQANY